MKKIKYGLAWLYIILINSGYAIGTIGLALMLIHYSPIYLLGITPVILTLIYVFFWVLLVIGSVGIDLIVVKEGMKKAVENGLLPIERKNK